MTKAPLVDVSSGVESAPGVKDVDEIGAVLQSECADLRILTNDTVQS